MVQRLLAALVLSALMPLPATAALPPTVSPDCSACLCAASAGCCSVVPPTGCKTYRTGICAAECAPMTCDTTAGATWLRSEVCTDTRWVGRVNSGAACPAAPAPWSTSRLFGATAQVDSRGDLGRYCLYVWTGTAPPTAPQLALLPPYLGVPAQTWLDKDCSAAAPLLGDPSLLFDETTLTLAESFRVQAEAPDSLPSSGLPPTRVAVIDTFTDDPASEGIVGPGGVVATGEAKHGRQVGAIIESLACPKAGSTCSVQVSPHLGMSYIRLDLQGNDANFGYQAHVAQSIYDATRAWQAAGGSLSGPRLVINLSLGWEPLYECDDEQSGERREAAESVHSAIRHAVCNGALVIAAAGNDPGGTIGGDGPMPPSAWETEAAPTSGRCAAICEGKQACISQRQGFDPQGCPKGQPGCYRPLVYGAGGLGTDDKAIGSTRNGGRPRLAAPAQEVVVPTDRFDWLDTPPMTGSSAAAAVVSGIAAARWRYTPTLSPGEIMDAIYDRAALTGEMASVSAGGAWGVRRVGMCRTLTTAPGVPQAGLSCQQLPAFGGEPPFIDWDIATLWQIAMSASWDVLSGLGLQLTERAAPAMCEQATVQARPADPFPAEDACSEQLTPASVAAPSLVIPQPPHDPCGQCLLMTNDPLLPGTAVLYMQVDSRLPAPLGAPTLVLSAGSPSVAVQSIDLSAAIPVVRASELYQVYGLAVDRAVRPYDHVDLVFRSLDGSGHVTSPVTEMRGSQ